MGIFMGIGERIVGTIERRWERNRMRLPGPLGDFYRNGGNEQLYDVPVITGDLIIDAGGYEGEWTQGMVTRYGCRSELFEPVPTFAANCQRLFARNSWIRVHCYALGGLSRTAIFSLASTGTSEFLPNATEEAFEVLVIDVAEFLKSLGDQPVACFKLNIEGGEYEVLERLLDIHQMHRFKSLLIQFHQQPPGWEKRREAIIERLWATHDQIWCYPMVWEKWVKR
ncbi:MAG: FkbM family methyltransferase [Candidatus Contendobacter sp.]|nr:FkbM family methyltransferase [Candidatus Contendobacter sp.]